MNAAVYITVWENRPRKGQSMEGTYTQYERTKTRERVTHIILKRRLPVPPLSLAK